MLIQSRKVVESFLQLLASEFVQKVAMAGQVSRLDITYFATSTYENWRQQLLARVIPPGELPPTEDNEQARACARKSAGHPDHAAGRSGRSAGDDDQRSDGQRLSQIAHQKHDHRRRVSKDRFQVARRVGRCHPVVSVRRPAAGAVGLALQHDVLDGEQPGPPRSPLDLFPAAESPGDGRGAGCFGRKIPERCARTERFGTAGVFRGPQPDDSGSRFTGAGLQAAGQGGLSVFQSQIHRFLRPGTERSYDRGNAGVLRKEQGHPLPRTRETGRRGGRAG